MPAVPHSALPTSGCCLYSSDDSLGAAEKSNFSTSDLQLKWAPLTRESIVLIQADQEPESNFYGEKKKKSSLIERY